MKNNTDKIHISKKFAISLIVTFSLLIGCLVPVFVGLGMDLFGEDYVEEDDGGTKKDKGNKPQDDTPTVIVQKEGEKTGIMLPSPTAQGTYLGAVGGDTKEINESNIKSSAAVIVDITAGTVVAGRKADTRVYPASMTKIMTLLVACERATDPNELLTVTQELYDKYNTSENEGASVAFYWKKGDQITVEDALHLIIYESDTYACWLLADYVADGEQGFVALMNQRASELGLTQTNFTNCTGLYNQNHYTTCREMAAIMAAVMNNTAARAVITRTSEYSTDIYRNGSISRTYAFYSGWYSVRLEAYRCGAAAPYYAGNGSDLRILSGKTGFETLPTNCFVTAGINEKNGHYYVCVQVGRTSYAEESVSPEESTDDTRLIYQTYAK